jgi:hypothetical protein
LQSQVEGICSSRKESGSMPTTSFSIAPRLRIEPSSAAVDEVEVYRIAARQAGWRVRQAERRLGMMLERLEGLAPDGPDHGPAVAEMHRCERALFNRRLELREACDAVRRHLPCRSTLDPEGWSQKPRVPRLGE